MVKVKVDNRPINTVDKTDRTKTLHPRSIDVGNKNLKELEMCRCDTDAPAGIAKLEYWTC